MIDPGTPEHNYVVVAGLRSPGRAQLTGVGTPYKWEEQALYGAGGANTIFKGRGILHPKLVLTFWHPTHFVAWEIFKKVLKPPSIVKPLAIQMRHPLLTSAEIDAVSVEFVGEPERQPNGMWTVKIDLIEYRPPRPALVKPRGAIPSPDKGAPIAPKTEADLALVAEQKNFELARNAARR